MIIRTRTEQDLPALVAVLRRVHDLHRYPVNWPDDPASWLSGDADVGSWVADLDGAPIGQVGIVDHGDGTGWIERLFVDPGCGRSGVGRSLLQHATRRTSDAGLAPRLEVADNGLAAQRLYQRAGWQLIDRVPVDWGGDVVRAVLRFAWPLTD